MKGKEHRAKPLTLTACIREYHAGNLSQGRAAELAGMSRAEFLAEISRRRVPILQMTMDEIAGELEHIRKSRR